MFQELLRGASAAQVAHLLLALAAFRAWVRPLAYGAVADDRTAALEALFPGLSLREVIDAPARDADAASYCPRCGQTWRQEAGSCPSCETVPLARWVVA
ncbi:MAG TPA: hypothetical protein VF178_11885 [Gemmatimonadaceae bacterium]